MAEKQDIRRQIKRLKSIKTWQLIILLVMVGFISLTFLRLNNVGMIERRDAVWAADKAGDDDALQRRLYDLQRYVSAHMGTDPGRIDLQHKYKRDNDAYIEQITQVSEENPNGNVSAKVREVCDAIGQANGWRWPDARAINCVNEELEKYPSAPELMQVYKPLSPEPYYQSFAPPLWSPDFAGWSIVVFIFIAIVIIFRLISLVTLRLMLKYRYRNA